MTFVVVVDFETTSTNHGHALELLDEYIDTFLRVQPGFIESWLSEKQIDRGYLHFARWRHESDFRAFAEKAQKHPLLTKIKSLNSSPSFYKPIRYYEPS